MKKCGGTSDVKDADEEIKGICSEIKGSLQEKLGGEDISIKAVKYKTQVVAGTNYFVKIEVTSKDAVKYVHARIFKPLPHTNMGPELQSIEENKKEEEEIKYF